jgi:hypothetical protein
MKQQITSKLSAALPGRDCPEYESTLNGVVQKVLVPGYTENRQSRANKGIPRFDCYPVLNHADRGPDEGAPRQRAGLLTAIHMS